MTDVDPAAAHREEATPAAPGVVIFDLETTGVRTDTDEIVEFSAQVGLGPGSTSWTCRMRPSMPIPAGASSVHGIRDADVAACARFPAHAERIRQILTGADVLVGYNLSFDLAILDAELERHGLPPLDLSTTLIVDAYALWRHEEPRTLSGAHARFVGASFEGAHRAADDVAATGRVLEGMLRHFGLEGASWETIAERAEPGRRRWIGPTHHVEWRAGVPVLTFGKHRGRALDAIAAEEEGGYLRWILESRQPAHLKRIARLALELDGPALRRRLVADYGAPPAPDGPRAEQLADARQEEDASHGARPAGASGPAATPAPSEATRRRPTPSRHPVILFDGVCNLCQGWVRFVIARDPRARFRFASLQSAIAERLLAAHPETRGVDAIVLVEDTRVHMKSAAALRILGHLGGGWRALTIFRVVPRGLRDAVYDLVARHRYRWFGKQESCMLPAPEIRARFIDQE